MPISGLISPCQPVDQHLSAASFAPVSQLIVLGSQEDGGEGTEISYMPSSATYAHPPLLKTSPLHGPFITTNEPMLTCHYHPVLVYTGLHSWGCIFCGFRQMHNNVSTIIISDRVVSLP